MSSWAIWSNKDKDKGEKSNIGDISFFENPSDELLNKIIPNIILVGLNISKKFLELLEIFIRITIIIMIIN